VLACWRPCVPPWAWTPKARPCYDDRSKGRLTKQALSGVHKPDSPASWQRWCQALASATSAGPSTRILTGVVAGHEEAGLIDADSFLSENFDEGRGPRTAPAGASLLADGGWRRSALAALSGHGSLA
jgi:hypothetical protein